MKRLHKRDLKPILAITLLLLCLFALCSCKKDVSAERESLGRCLSRTVKEEVYTPSSYSAYQTAYQNAEAVYQDPSADAERLTTAEGKLQAAYEALALRADLSSLKALMETVYPESDYTVESYAGYRQALEKAETICANPESKQVLVDSAKEVLTAAIAGLERKTDTAELADLLATKILEEPYTSTSYARYANVLAEAIELYGRRSEEMTKQQAAEYAQDVAICTMELKSAIEGLVFKGKTEDLKKAVEEIQKATREPSAATGGRKPEEFYTEASFTALSAILEQAANAAESGDYGQKELDQYLQSLRSAYAALEIRCDATKLEELVLLATGEYLENPDDYTTDSYIALNNQVNQAKDLLQKEGKSQEEVDQALAALQNAIGKLQQISIPANGKTDHLFKESLLFMEGTTVRIGNYLQNRDSFLKRILSLTETGELQMIESNEETGVYLVETANHVRVRLEEDRIHIYLREDLQQPEGDCSITLIGVRLGFTPLQVSDKLGAPTVSQKIDGYRIQSFKDGTNGISLMFKFHHDSDTVIEMSFSLSD